MKQSDRNEGNRGLTFSIALAGVLGIGGLITLGIVIVFLLGGLWLDRIMDTRPFFTLLLMIVSAPISIFAMYRVAMSSISKINPPVKRTDGDNKQSK
ncbi:MAG: AtpZ/AtpI family protein [Anaerolineales bacterium]